MLKLYPKAKIQVFFYLVYPSIKNTQVKLLILFIFAVLRKSMVIRLQTKKCG